ncbi:MAG: peptidyl-prolyl cis-trans isomerase [Armatimonadetes bacterium]|nr:peptidyl-prolyl cis-trans isomerase [Armatimonadota bacterium]
MLSVLLSGLLFPTLLAQVDPGKVIFSVNGEEVKGGEYYRRMEYLGGVGRVRGNSFEQFPPGLLTIEQIITEKLILQMAKDRGVMPSEKDIDDEIKYRMEDTPKLLDDWMTTGQTKDELRYQMRINLCQLNMLTQGITVTDQQVQTFYNENPSMFTNPKQVQLQVIVVSDDATKQKVDADLAAGKKFADVATAYSIDVSKMRGGEFGTVPVRSLNKEMQDAVNPLKAGGITPWMNSNGSFVRFLVENVIPESKLELNDSLKRKVRRQLMQDRGKVKNDIRKEMADMFAKAKIDIKEKEFSVAFKKLIEEYLKERNAAPGAGQ